MNNLAISVHNVSKSFRRYNKPSDRLKELLFPSHRQYQEFQALNNVSLEIPRGQTLGIVGRNGSGKSTLLQIIVGTLMASSGTVNVQGRISALLELGSGFNPEFTGRQNVFFNGQLLGLSHTQIEERFDDIVAFADIGDFLDQPTKTYSSGMFVRLAFAVATSVEPDILVVDEALAVGDEAFQRKCFARIASLQAQGCTTLFVSHAASKVVELCDRAVLLDRGEALMSHRPKFVIDQYHKLIYAPEHRYQKLREDLKLLPDGGLWPDDDPNGLPVETQAFFKTSKNSVSHTSTALASDQKIQAKIKHFSDIEELPEEFKSSINWEASTQQTGIKAGLRTVEKTDDQNVDITEKLDINLAASTTSEITTPVSTKRATQYEVIEEFNGLDRDFFDPELTPKNTISYIPRGATIQNPHLETLDGRMVNHITGRHDYVYTYDVLFDRTATNVRFGMLIKTVSGLELGGASFTAIAQKIRTINAGSTVAVRFKFRCLLNPGVYFLNAGVSGTVGDNFTYLARGIDIAMFRVQPETDSFASGILDLLIEPEIYVKPQDQASDIAIADPYSNFTRDE